MTSTALVARTVERQVLADALAGLLRHSGGTVAIVGPAGIGKSRLAREAVFDARRHDVPVLAGRAVPGSVPVAYRPLSEALLAWTRTNGTPGIATAEPYGRALSRLLAMAPVDDGGPLSPVFVAEAVLRLLVEIGGDTGTLLLVDDLRWADDETLAVVEYLADHAGIARLLLVLTARREEGRRARELLHALSARGAATVIDLAPLDGPAVAEMAAHRLGGPAAPRLASLLLERSEGLPLLVDELISALRVGGALIPADAGIDVDDDGGAVVPSSVADAVEARLQRLSDTARTVVQAAAAFGRAFDWQRLPRVTGCTEAEVVAALSAAAELQLLDEDPLRPGALRFRHALLRDAVEAATFPPERALLARRALDAMAPGGAASAVPDDDLPLAVGFAIRCDDTALASRLALRSAVSAFRRWALQTAERWLAEARRLAGSDPQLLSEIDVEELKVAAVVGRLEVVDRVGAALLSRLEAGQAADAVRLETHLRLAQVAIEDGRWEEGERHLALVAPLLPSSPDPSAVTRYELWSAVSALQQGNSMEARFRAARAIELATRYEDQLDLVCCAVIQTGRAWLPDADAARQTWDRGLRLATAHGMRLWRARLLTEVAGCEVAELAGEELLEDALALAREAGAVELVQRTELLRAELALLRGAYETARSRLDAAERAVAGTVVVSATRDRADAARALLSAVRGDSGGVAASAGARGDPWARCARGVLALALDDLVSACAAAPSSGSALAPWVASAFDVVLAVLAGHQEVTAAGVAGRAGRLAAAALAAGRVGEADLAAERLAAAVSEASGAPWLAAELTRIVAPEVVAAGGGEGARPLLRDAAIQLERAGLARPADACRALLRDTGVAVPRRTSAQAGVPASLRAVGVTARELEVLRLLADGLTSREIGDRLYLSPRTVEKHVERLLAKTGAANRAALTAMLLAAGT